MASGPAEVALPQCMQCWQKQKELEATMMLENCVLAAITEAWWDESLDCSAAIDG